MTANLTNLLGLLDKEGKSALERSAEFCITQGHYEVSVAHLLLQYLDNPRSDTHTILRHFDIDPIQWIKSLLKKLESCRNDNTSRPVFSSDLLRWLEDSSALNTTDSKPGEIRANYLIAKLAQNPARYGVHNLAGLDKLVDIDDEMQLSRILLPMESPEAEVITPDSAQPDTDSEEYFSEDTAIFDIEDGGTVIVDIDFSHAQEDKHPVDNIPDALNIPGYQIIRKIGQGGMADVYLANHLGLEREVALKVLSPSLNDDTTFTQRFLREARIVAKLAHPNIIQIYDVNHVDEHNYLAMEYISEGELTDRLSTDFPLALVLDITRQVLGALISAHEKGYIHRDIKPANILFRKDGSAVLTDFGIARAINIDSGMTMAGVLVGTPSYMSPEQARGEKVDLRSDLYSMGVLFYRMVEGKLPFKGDTAMATALRQITDPVPRMSDVNVRLQPFLDRAMAKNVKDRFQSGDEMIAALNLLESDL